MPSAIVELDAPTLVAWNQLAAEKLEGWRWVVSTHPNRPRCFAHRFLEHPDAINRTREFYGLADATGDEPAWPFTNPECDYAHDLNAVSRLEALVRERGEWPNYSYWLATICHQPERGSSDALMDMVCATAAQRLEAVLVACGLIGARDEA